MQYTTAILALAAVVAAQSTTTSDVQYTCAPDSASDCSPVTVSSSAAAAATTAASAASCQTAYNTCRQPTNGVSANQAVCAAEYAACLGTNPFASNGTNTVTTSSASVDVGDALYFTTEVVTSFTTYCPAATTLTYNNKVYTVSSATTLTVTDCPCTITKSASSTAPAEGVSTSIPGGCNPAHPGSCPTTSSVPAGGVSTSTVPAGGVSTSIPGGCNPAHSGSCPSSYFSTATASASGNATRSATSTVAVFTGAASREIVGAGSVLAAIGSFFFLF